MTVSLREVFTNDLFLPLERNSKFGIYFHVVVTVQLWLSLPSRPDIHRSDFTNISGDDQTRQEDRTFFVYPPFYPHLVLLLQRRNNSKKCVGWTIFSGTVRVPSDRFQDVVPSPPVEV